MHTAKYAVLTEHTSSRAPNFASLASHTLHPAITVARTVAASTAFSGITASLTPTRLATVATTATAPTTAGAFAAAATPSPSTSSPSHSTTTTTRRATSIAATHTSTVRTTHRSTACIATRCATFAAAAIYSSTAVAAMLTTSSIA